MSDRPDDSSETQVLLKQALDGDREAQDRLFARHRAWLRQVIAMQINPGLRGRIDASDIVQETQIEANRKLPRFGERQAITFRAWLRGIARNRLNRARRQHFATARRDARHEVPLPDRSSIQLVDQLLADTTTPSRCVGRREMARLVRQAVAQLPDAEREIVLMRVFEGLSNLETAHVLGIDPATGSRRYARALLRLHDKLRQAGVEEEGP